MGGWEIFWNCYHPTTSSICILYTCVSTSLVIYCWDSVNDFWPFPSTWLCLEPSWLWLIDQPLVPLNVSCFHCLLVLENLVSIFHQFTFLLFLSLSHVAAPLVDHENLLLFLGCLSLMYKCMLDLQVSHRSDNSARAGLLCNQLIPHLCCAFRARCVVLAINAPHSWAWVYLMQRGVSRCVVSKIWMATC